MLNLLTYLDVEQDRHRADDIARHRADDLAHHLADDIARHFTRHLC